MPDAVGRPLTVVSVAYPFATVGVDAVGGAEQMLSTIERGLVAAGHRSIVVAAEGSRCEGRLIATPRVTGALDERARAAAARRHEAAIRRALARERVDLIHAHGHDFPGYLPNSGTPLLATLHLPASSYAPEVFGYPRPRSFFNLVSSSQRRGWPPSCPVIATIENGVDLEALGPGDARGEHVLALGRICPEKGFHRALDAAREANVSMLLAGEVFAYAEHQRYFREEIAPRLDARRRFIGPVGLADKRELLAGARCLLVASEIAETSCLVAIEALACGTPVISFAVGALTELIEPGRTGFLVADEREMAAAIGRVDSLDRRACRRAAERRFCARRMVGEYLELYERVISSCSRTVR